MKELLKSLLILCGSLLVTIFVFWFLFLYQLGYSIWLSITLKRWYAFFVFWWKNIDGILSCIGHFIYHLAYSLDLLWNVNGEALEDMFTAKEETEFGKKNTSVSASIGKLQISGDLNKFGKRFSKFLNFIFGQSNHAEDSWMMKIERERLDNKYFN